MDEMQRMMMVNALRGQAAPNGMMNPMQGLAQVLARGAMAGSMQPNSQNSVMGMPYSPPASPKFNMTKAEITGSGY